MRKEFLTFKLASLFAMSSAFIPHVQTESLEL